MPTVDEILNYQEEPMFSKRWATNLMLKKLDGLRKRIFRIENESVDEMVERDWASLLVNDIIQPKTSLPKKTLDF